MKKSVLLSAPLVVLAMCGITSPAYADSADAMCEVHKDGQTKQGKSGPCTFSQRQGYIDIDLRNGENYSLSPGGQPSHFKDQKGNKVVRSQAGGGTHVYKWDGGKKITVSFGASAADDGGGAMAGATAAPAREPTTTTQRVRFPAGGSGAELTGTLCPGCSTRYVLQAKKGQDLYVRVAPKGPNVDYQIFNPDGTFLLDLMTSSKEYRGQLWQTGDHVVEVINRGNQTTSYNVIFGL
jgi:hypothetical protein